MFKTAMKTIFSNTYVKVAAVVALIVIASVAFASHSWGGYHWALSANPFTVKIGDNVSTAWDAHLNLAANNWNASDVLDAAVVAGKSSQKNCRPTSGRVEVCNSKYGNNGWLGIAQIWASGSHITQGVVKMNDTYFNRAQYNTPAWRQFVVCQEVGHTFGLDHQDETFNNPNLGTCMDYTNDPSGTIGGQLGNTVPNQHDFDELAAIYDHIDALSSPSEQAISPASAADADVTDPSKWGKELRKSSNGRSSLYGRDLGNGRKIFTFVIWAD